MLTSKFYAQLLIAFYSELTVFSVKF